MADLGGNSTSLQTIVGLHDIDPQFRLYLQHNDFPGAHVLEKLAKIKSEPLEELRSLERDVQALETVLGSLKRKKETLKSFLSTYDSILAPIRRLPDDTLEEIFRHCLPTTRNARPFVSESPLLLTLVCKKWRRVALAAPRLWTTLHVPIVFNFQQTTTSPPYAGSLGMHRAVITTVVHHARLLELQNGRKLGLDQWLRRSGTLPLSISLYSSPTLRRPLFGEMTLDLVARYADRISALDVTTPHCIVVALGETIVHHFDFEKLPRLRNLRLSYSKPISSSSGGQSLSHAPKFFSGETLRELSLQGQGISSIDQYILNDLSSSITVLSIHTPIVLPLAYRLLFRLQQLERCHLSISERSLLLVASGQAFNTDLVHIPLPALKTMSIHGILPVIDALCPLLGTPSLSNLQLYVEGQRTTMGQITFTENTGHGAENRHADIDLPYPPASTEHLSMFLSQCASLRTLIINPTYIQAAELQSIFSSVPQTECLILKNCGDPRPGDPSSALGPSTEIQRPRYAIHPLFKQERVCISTGESVKLEEPLLPRLSSFTWSQFSPHIPVDLLSAFIKSRLYRPTHTNAFDAVDGIPLKVTPLKTVTLKFTHVNDAKEIEAELVRHAESAGLKAGSDFKLVSTGQHMTPVPQYVAPKGYSRRAHSIVSADNLFPESNITWPMNDI